MSAPTSPATLTFDIRFRGPFHVSTGGAAEGIDSVVDRKVPLPASSVKGAMRAEARGRLRLAPSIVEAVFGSSQTASPWRWSDVKLGPVHLTRRARIRVADDDRGLVGRGFLMLGEQVWASTGEFTIEYAGVLEIEPRPEHILVLDASARSLTALGGSRRRGGGWVSVVPHERPWSVDRTRQLREIR